MNNLKSLPFLFVFLMGLLSFQSAKGQVSISLDDFKVLNNTSWEGTLTYLDYQSGKLTPIATTMQMRITDKAIETDLQYTWEPDKNVQVKTRIRKNGTHLGKQKVISKTQKEDGTMHLMTSSEGKDDNRKATLYYTYEFSIDGYHVTKEVQFEGSNERFLRNKYDYKKI